MASCWLSMNHKPRHAGPRERSDPASIEIRVSGQNRFWMRVLRTSRLTTSVQGPYAVLVRYGRLAMTLLALFTAATGEEALILASGQAIELALIDFGLPDMEGDELGPRLRGMPSSSRARLVGVSGDGSADQKIRAKILGFDDVLLKPIREPQIVALVEEVLAELAR